MWTPTLDALIPICPEHLFFKNKYKTVVVAVVWTSLQVSDCDVNVVTIGVAIGQKLVLETDKLITGRIIWVTVEMPVVVSEVLSFFPPLSVTAFINESFRVNVLIYIYINVWTNVQPIEDEFNLNN